MAVRPRVAAALAGADQERFLNAALNGVEPDPQDQDAPQDDPQDQDEPQDDPQDDPQDQDEPQDDTQDQDEPQDAPQEPARRRQVRADADYISPAAQRAIAEANRLATEAVQRAAEVTAHLQSRGESPEQEAARLALMTPEQQIEYKVNKSLGNHSRQMGELLFNSQNTADQTAFNALVTSNPQLKRFADEVEKKHNELVLAAKRTNGNAPTRETVLTYLLGQRALEIARKATPQQEARQRRVQRQTVRAPDTRGDVSTQRRPQQKSLEERLAGVLI